MIGGGLSLLFPNCWRRPLPNTLTDVENKNDLNYPKKGPISNSMRGMPGYTSNFLKSDPGDGAYPLDMNEKTDAKALQHEMDLCYREPNPEASEFVTEIANGTLGRSSAVFGLNPMAHISELETFMGTANWHLQHRQIMESNRSLRDFQLYPKTSQVPTTSPSTVLVVENTVQKVAETNL